MSETDRPQRILIVKLTAIGDVIHALPALCALRDAWADVKIGWVVEGAARQLLEGHPAIDELIVAPRRWIRRWKDIRDLRRRLRAFGPDVTIDMQGLTKSAVAAWLSGAKRRIGFKGELGRELSAWLNNDCHEATADHVVDNNRGLLKALGVPEQPVRFGLPHFPKEQANVDAWLDEQSLEQGGFVLFNPGAGWASRWWPTDRFGAVASHAGKVHGLSSVVVWAGDDEKQKAEEIVSQSEGHARLAMPTTLRELAAMCRRARAFVSSDTGPLHLAAAVGTPCVSMHGPTIVRKNGPYGDQHIPLQEVELHGGSRERRNASNDAMKAIKVEQVCEALDQVITRQRDESVDGARL